MSLFSFGNTKLPKTTAIFNITPARDCPSQKLGLCQLKDAKKCYALKAERMYKQVIPFRERQKLFWENCTIDEFVNELNKCKKKVTHLRLNESGDFRNQDDVEKANKIAEKLRVIGIVTYCYTARKDLDFSKATTLVVNGSGFMVDNNFSVGYTEDELLEYVGTSKMFVCVQNCSICRICTKKGNKFIKIRLH